MIRQQQLILWAAQQIGLPFVWGKSDCTTLTLEGVNLLYNETFNLENTWTSLKEALRAYKKYGTPIEILEKYGFEKVKKNYEQTGDILVWEGTGYYLIGIVINQSVLVADEGKLISFRPIVSFINYTCYRKNQ